MQRLLERRAEADNTKLHLMIELLRQGREAGIRAETATFDSWFYVVWYRIIGAAMTSGNHCTVANPDPWRGGFVTFVDSNKASQRHSCIRARFVDGRDTGRPAGHSRKAQSAMRSRLGGYRTESTGRRFRSG